MQRTLPSPLLYSRGAFSVPDFAQNVLGQGIRAQQFGAVASEEERLLFYESVISSDLMIYERRQVTGAYLPERQAQLGCHYNEVPLSKNSMAGFAPSNER